jgi:hypothetical protein
MTPPGRPLLLERPAGRWRLRSPLACPVRSRGTAPKEGRPRPGRHGSGRVRARPKSGGTDSLLAPRPLTGSRLGATQRSGDPSPMHFAVDQRLHLQRPPRAAFPSVAAFQSSPRLPLRQFLHTQAIVQGPHFRSKSLSAACARIHCPQNAVSAQPALEQCPLTAGLSRRRFDIASNAPQASAQHRPKRLVERAQTLAGVRPHALHLSRSRSAAPAVWACPSVPLLVTCGFACCCPLTAPKPLFLRACRTSDPNPLCACVCQSARAQL